MNEHKQESSTTPSDKVPFVGGLVVGLFCGALSATFAYNVANQMDNASAPAMVPESAPLTKQRMQAVKRINTLASRFAEHYSMCALEDTPSEKYLKTHRLIASFVDSALLPSVDSVQFANNIEHAMIGEMRIVPATLPTGVLAVFHDALDGGKDVMLIEKDLHAIYGAIPKFFNDLASREYNTGGQTTILISPERGKYENVTVTDPNNIVINGKQLAGRLDPQLRLSSPCLTPDQ